MMVPNRIKELRKERKLRQEELALKINVSQQTISRMEKGENTLPADILVALSQYFGVSADYILFLSNNRRILENQVEFHEIQERNYNLCRIYETLNRKNQELIFNLTEELGDNQSFQVDRNHQNHKQK